MPQQMKCAIWQRPHNWIYLQIALFLDEYLLFRCFCQKISHKIFLSTQISGELVYIHIYIHIMQLCISTRFTIYTLDLRIQLTKHRQLVGETSKHCHKGLWRNIVDFFRKYIPSTSYLPASIYFQGKKYQKLIQNNQSPLACRRVIPY